MMSYTITCLFLCCLGSSWLVARVRYDCAYCLVMSHVFRSWVNLQQALCWIPAHSEACNVLLWLKAADIEPFLTRGENFKWRGWQSDLFSSVDLCHRWWDIHSRRNHRLLYIHRVRGMEEDPDRENVMRTAPRPSSHLIYKCKVASLLAKSNPCSNRLPFGDYITVTNDSI